MQATLLLQYVKWHVFDAPRELLKAWGNMLWFGFNYFSVPLLLQTYFSPWRRITWDYGRGFSVGRYLFTFASNLVSRILGAIMRTFLIAAGVFAELVVLMGGIAVLVFWFALPALIAIAFVYGLFFLLF